jgi:tRNA uridine 5-carbamoylmethylation protein Kti12
VPPMTLVIIFGPPAVGRMTIGLELKQRLADSVCAFAVTGRPAIAASGGAMQLALNEPN